MKRNTKDELAAYARTLFVITAGAGGAIFLVKVLPMTHAEALAWLVGAVCLWEILEAKKAQDRFRDWLQHGVEQRARDAAQEVVAQVARCPYGELLDRCGDCGARAFAEAHQEFGGRSELGQVSQEGGGSDE